MIVDEIKLRPRYGEVDQMGYVYHANYISFCHQGRTELLRKMNLSDSQLEDQNIMLPVLDFNIRYKKPAHYDEVLTVKTILKEVPVLKCNFEFEIYNQQGELITVANSTVAFVKKDSRVPLKVPGFVRDAMMHAVY